MRFKLTILISLLLIIFGFTNVSANERVVNLYYFHAEGCSTCALETVYLEKLVEEEPNLVLHQYEIAFDQENQKLSKDVGELLNQPINSTPTLIIGREIIVGFKEGSTEKTIEDAIQFVRDNNVRDVVGEMLGIVEPGQGVDVINENSKVSLPFFGEVDAKSISLPLLAIVLGGIDGFNPCAMWVLLLLISMLFHLEEQWKKWFLGGLFLLTTGVMYFFFMLSWLNITILFGTLIYIRWLIGGMSIGGGIFNIHRFTQMEPGCEVVDESKRLKIRDRLKAIYSQPVFALAAVGIVVLAVSVNLVELICSAGLPVLFTQILTLNDLSQTQYIQYLLLYLAMFMLDDIIVFVIAMKTAELTGISTKYARNAHLIGGILMILLGLLMILKPAWLMLNFG
ncbi:MAG: thioredoxin family protein [Erysipelotrichaceae bacterium]